MKNLLKGAVILIAVLMILNIASAGYAQSMANKLNRGLTNIFTGWFEIPKNMSGAFSKHDFASAFFIGLPKGCGMTIVRTAAGIYDTVTFAIPLPKDYKPILEPEFAFTGK
ncbi:MAG: exosortase system-associated protein, TIGR04073 family [Candidatus Omnitrophota bacterium]|jgi:putative exosortase-associated protein (TIGR04073 family)|nr:exosortase system-associated protein, TIGR04073 family [Candidatus Omnitrophota bacterium]